MSERILSPQYCVERSGKTSYVGEDGVSFAGVMRGAGSVLWRCCLQLARLFFVGASAAISRCISVGAALAAQGLLNKGHFTFVCG